MIYLSLPMDKSSSKLADWLEINTLLDKDRSTSRQDLVSALLPEEEPVEDLIGESPADKLSIDAFNEIQRRIRSTKNGYPFSLDGEKIVSMPNIKKFLPYIFCLLISYFGNEKLRYSTYWKLHNVAKQFEELSANVMHELLRTKKCKSKVKVFGWPRNWEGNVTNPNFQLALRTLCNDSGEMFSQERKTSMDMKDAGLDIVAWKKFPDNLQGSIVFWGQCATGDDWDKKLDNLKDFDFFVTSCTPMIKGIFIPHIPEVSTDKDIEIWLYYTLKAGIIFNRCRIAYLSRNWKSSLASRLCLDALKNIRKTSSAS